MADEHMQRKLSARAGSGAVFLVGLLAAAFGVLGLPRIVWVLVAVLSGLGLLLIAMSHPRLRPRAAFIVTRLPFQIAYQGDQHVSDPHGAGSDDPIRLGHQTIQNYLNVLRLSVPNEGTAARFKAELRDFVPNDGSERRPSSWPLGWIGDESTRGWIAIAHGETRYVAVARFDVAAFNQNERTRAEAQASGQSGYIYAHDLLFPSPEGDDHGQPLYPSWDHEGQRHHLTVRLLREAGGYLDTRIGVGVDGGQLVGEIVPSDTTPIRREEQRSAVPLVEAHMKIEAARLEKVSALTPLVEECNRLLGTLEAKRGDWDELHRVPEWTTRADDTITRVFGAPSDFLARNHPLRDAPGHMIPPAREAWQQADRRRGWIVEKLKTLEER
jgi:hypothetical protein